MQVQNKLQEVTFKWTRTLCSVLKHLWVLKLDLVNLGFRNGICGHSCVPSERDSLAEPLCPGAAGGGRA